MDEPNDDPTIGEKEVESLMIVDMVFYSLVLCFASYMIIKHLILDKRHEITYLPAFYSLTVLLAVLKLCQCITEYTYSGETYQLYVWNISSCIGAQTKL